YVFKDDYSLVFGKHMLKVGGLFSTNKKNEDVLGYGSAENSAFWGSTGLGSTGVGTGNILADFLLKDMTFGFSEASGQRQVPQRWKDLEFYASDSWKVSPRLTFDYGIRYSLFYNPYAADNRIMSFDPASFNPSLGDDPCNGLLQPTGTNWCQQAGLQGGATGPNRSVYPQDYHNFAPRLGVAWDIKGDGKSAIRAGLGQFYLRERLSPGLNIGNNPPFITTVSGNRSLDTNSPDCDGCSFGNSLGSPSAGREQSSKTPNNWQWNVSYQKEVYKNTTVEVGYVGSKGVDLLTVSDADQIGPGDINNNGIPDRREYVLSSPANGALRPYGAEFGDKKITFWGHDGHSMYHSLQSQLISRWGASQAQVSYTLSRTTANVPLDDSNGNLGADGSLLDLSNPSADEGLANTDRRHVFNAALVLALPTMEDQHGVKAAVLGGWEIGTILQAASGQALTVFTGALPGLNGGPSGTGYTDNQRPNMATDGNCRAHDSSVPEQILDPAAFTLVGFQLGSIGNEKRGQCTGPGLFQTDVSFYKTIRAFSKAQLQLRFEIFNVFNNLNFEGAGSGGGGLNNNMSLQSVTLDPAQTQIIAYTPSGSFGQATRTRDARQAQFGIKILF
ncbi:MAG TPA: hypothetical protein VH458_16785, partial [Vicinamibacterales bacterium]